ncbi:MAG: DEAD/DEAH box helicase [Hyphomicrobiales bacterium]|nr:DEAD/DEAH box helicase [Hyphomicrobiales bacterium]
MTTGTFAVGSLVRARGREWVVLPDSQDEMLVLRPLGGTEDEVTGIYLPLETVEPASFGLPDPDDAGDDRSCRLLRDAVRLGFRSSAGPFRSFARIGVEPRPYQLVPLLMALKLDPVRLLIADDVGIGKTIEAGLIARELLDRNEIKRMVVLCPPHLAEQWQSEMRTKFHLDAEVVLPGTVGRLERQRRLRLDQSIFDVYPFLIVSIDYIKSDRRRADFLRAYPEFVIVDEAHTCAFGEGSRGRHQRYSLVKSLAGDPDRHLVLVTATPHSGKEESFRSLLSLLNPGFADLPGDLTGPRNEPHRRRLAEQFVQRRRGDIRHYLKVDTPFPQRQEREVGYRLTPEYRKLFERALAYARETVLDGDDNHHRQRVRWWSALALLRSLGSSPAAAAATLRTRAATADTRTSDEANDVGQRIVLDLDDDDTAERMDVAPGSDIGELADDQSRNRRRLLEMAREAEALRGNSDEKLRQAVPLIQSLLDDGFSPIVFCRFIPTAEYLAAELRDRLKRGVTVEAVTGTLPPAEREARVEALGQAGKRVLVSTDCLSEGINLQQHFDAVMHYDLSWNPTRHEQREGRVDRYGQPKATVRVVTYYGLDNQIDGIVLDVLIRKHKSIRNSLGVSVPVPVESNDVIEAIFEGLLLRERSGSVTSYLPGFEEFFKPKREALFSDWDSVAERERRSRTMFAQESIKVDEVARELRAVRSAIGSGVDVERFTIEALRAHGAAISKNGVVTFDLREVPDAIRDLVDLKRRDRFSARFELPAPDGAVFLSRTHPIVEGLAAHVMDTALDPLVDGIARRAGAIRTTLVQTRTTLLLLRFRFDIRVTGAGVEGGLPLLAEDVGLVAFEGAPASARWIDAATANALLDARPDANIDPRQASEFVRRVTSAVDQLRPHIDEVARRRGDELLDAHRRVREAARIRGVRYSIEPKLPPDVLGIYVYLPARS